MNLPAHHPGECSHPSGWIGVDFDGTLAEYHGWSDELGKPIEPMTALVKKWLSEGRKVKIFTARIGALYDEFANDDEVANARFQRRNVQKWCEKHLGQALEITCVKDMHMIELYDDRAVQVEANTGRLLGQSTRGLV